MTGRGLSRRALLAGAGGLVLPPIAAPARAEPRRTTPGVTLCPVPTREVRVRTTGGLLYARANAPADPSPARLPALFLHGGPGGSHLGMVGALPLADTRDIILYDQLDCGLSARPGRASLWTVDRFVDEIDDVRRALGLARVHLSGTSWGGTLALEYAARRPEGLASLALLSPLVSTRAWLEDAAHHIANLPRGYQQAIAEAQRTGNYEADSFQEADRYYARQHLSRERLSPLHLACQGRRDPWFNLDLYTHMWGPSEFVVTGSLRDYDGEPLLARVAVPTLLVAGEHDEARPATLRRFANAMADARVEVAPGSGHWIENDRPQAHRRILKDWLYARDVR
jgi:proline iminopeptidase/L-proline amide hydrolase